MFPTWQFTHAFICLSLTKLVSERDNLKTNQPILLQIGTSGLGWHRHEMINFEGQ